MKSSVLQSSVQVNDQTIDDVQYLDPFTLYINPYYVVTELQGGDKISKHYYMNTQRVATMKQPSGNQLRTKSASFLHITPDNYVQLI